MSLLSDLDALNDGHPVGEVPDEVTGRWPLEEAGSQVRANLVRVNEGREIAARMDALPHGAKQEEIAAWMKRLGRSERLVRKRMATARQVLKALEEGGDAGRQLDSLDALNCRYDEVPENVREALSLPTLEKREREEKPPPTETEVAAAWQELGVGHVVDGIDPQLMIAAARAVIAEAEAKLQEPQEEEVSPARAEEAAPERERRPEPEPEGDLDPGARGRRRGERRGGRRGGGRTD